MKGLSHTILTSLIFPVLYLSIKAPNGQIQRPIQKSFYCYIIDLIKGNFSENNNSIPFYFSGTLTENNKAFNLYPIADFFKRNQVAVKLDGSSHVQTILARKHPILGQIWCLICL